MLGGMLNGEATPGALQGWIGWSQRNLSCEVSYNLGASIMEVVSTTSNYAAIGFSDHPSSLNTSCAVLNLTTSTSSTLSLITPHLCPKTDPVPIVANASLELWCSFECQSITPDTEYAWRQLDGLDYQACLQAGAAQAVEQQLPTAYINWNPGYMQPDSGWPANQCYLVIQVQQDPRESTLYGVTIGIPSVTGGLYPVADPYINAYHANWTCAIVTTTVTPDADCTPTYSAEDGWQSLCGYLCVSLADEYQFRGPSLIYPLQPGVQVADSSSTQSNWTACQSWAKTLLEQDPAFNDSPDSYAAVIIDWSQTTHQCFFYHSYNHVMVTKLANPNLNCAFRYNEKAYYKYAPYYSPDAWQNA